MAKNQQTPLMWAVLRGHVPVARQLLAAKAAVFFSVFVVRKMFLLLDFMEIYFGVPSFLFGLNFYMFPDVFSFFLVLHSFHSHSYFAGSRSVSNLNRL